MMDRHHQQIIFVEVKLRQDQRFGGAAAAITRRQQQRIYRAALVFLQQYARYRHYQFRFDAVLYSRWWRRPDWRRNLDFSNF